VAGVWADSKCSWMAVLDYLNLTSNRDRLIMTRPSQDWRVPTNVSLDVYIYAIQAVQEKSQTFIPYIWVMTEWTNELLSWQPDQFCGIQQVAVPRELLWKPDLLLFETMERDKDTGSPFVLLKHDGTVIMDGYRKVLSTCAMDVFKFPFDTQRCTLSFSSAIHSDKELLLFPTSNSSRATRNSEDMMEKEVSEWEFINLTVQRLKLPFNDENWDKLVYTISIRRVPLLYVLTFILPILFLLLLDLASFFMSDAQGQKTGFKVTVLLTMSVLLLILNETLPNKPRRTPLIAVYVMVTFGFMLLSLMESILVGYLIDRADTQHSREAGNRKSVGGIICVANGECQQEATPMKGCPDPAEGDERGEGGDPAPLQGSEGRDPVPFLLRLIHQDLQNQNLLLRNQYYHQNQNQAPPRNQNSLANYINTTFFIVYLLSVSIFLPTLFITWMA
ncbi:5-hydroxytryptamine receptor 3A-like, partial [Engraulis encrasicolus]|uniref:5-hydroxytryptamine receptor 3A-like n=1 Tax=Engraulis encrasicolus TaxID=184585 RepID=UPI002FD3F741